MTVLLPCFRGRLLVFDQEERSVRSSYGQTGARGGDGDGRLGDDGAVDDIPMDCTAEDVEIEFKIRSRTSVNGSISRRRIGASNCAVSEMRCGNCANDRPSPNISLGVALPSVTLASRRSRSCTSQAPCADHHAGSLCPLSSPTASRRGSISSSRQAGFSKRRLSKRPPMPVQVLSST